YYQLNHNQINQKAKLKRQNIATGSSSPSPALHKIFVHSLSMNIARSQSSYIITGSILIGQPDALWRLSRHSSCATVYTDSINKIIGPSLQDFANSLCIDYISSGSYTRIYNTVEVVEKIEADIRREKVVLRMLLHSNPKLEAQASRVCQVCKILENLLCAMMEGANIPDLQARGLLLYQNTC
ncbi:hypothetical protein V8E55_002575, partial [Tylopilus felleus]